MPNTPTTGHIDLYLASVPSNTNRAINKTPVGSVKTGGGGNVNVLQVIFTILTCSNENILVALD